MKNIVLFIFFGFFCLKVYPQKINTSLTYLVKTPAKKSNKTPVLILLHGYGSNEADLFDLSPGLDNRFIVFSLRAPNVVSSEGCAWYKMEFLGDQKFKYNYKDTRESRIKILSFISNACRAYDVDSTQVYLLGFSQGAIMSYDLAFAAPGKIKGVLALSGRMLEETKAIKTDWQKITKIKFFIAHGNLDNVIKITDSEKVYQFLDAKKVTEIAFNKYIMAHAINGSELDDIKRWLSSAINSTNEPGLKK
ncbi:MAG: hypothetical protein V4635_16310 [Bacteroidota bacterium]